MRAVLSMLLACAAAALVAGCGGGSATTSSSATSAAATSASSSTASSTATTAPSSTETTPGSASGGANTSSTSSPGTPAEIHLSSSALTGNPEEAHPIPARYTCAGANVSLPLKWGLVPSGSAEVGVFVMHHAARGRLAADWALLGLPAGAGELHTGQTPPGAIVGRNSTGSVGYSVCPPRGKELEYGVFVFAFKGHSGLHSGFNAVAAFEKALAGAATGQGLIGFTFKR